MYRDTDSLVVKTAISFTFKMFLSNCNDTLIVQLSACVCIQRLFHNLAGERIDPNSFFRNLVVCFDRSATGQNIILVSHLCITHVHGLDLQRIQKINDCFNCVHLRSFIAISRFEMIPHQITIQTFNWTRKCSKQRLKILHKMVSCFFVLHLSLKFLNI